MTEKKEKQYVSDNAHLMDEWHWERNNALGLSPAMVTANSHKKAWWNCSNGHEWQAVISSRNRGNGCPVCAGRIVVRGENDLLTLNPELAKEWNYEKNDDLTPSQVTISSGKIVWWKCDNGHEWKRRIADRNAGQGCPYCSGRLTISGVNDLQTVNSNLAEEWNLERNGHLSPANILPNSNRKVWWKCAKGHEWQATVSHRSRGQGCPYCSGRVAISGTNDLLTLNPELAKEWNYEKNQGLRPEEITLGSEKKVWWRCARGHEWQASVYKRNTGNGCPICSSGYRTSFPEFALIYYFSKSGIAVFHSYNTLGYELDVYIPQFRSAIEYDGYYWHKGKASKDLEKNAKCKESGIQLYRIREDLPPLDDSSIDYVVRTNQSDLSEIIQRIIFDITGRHIDVDIQRDYISIEGLREHIEKKASLLITNPELAEEWNYEKNGNILPEHVSAGSEKRVWWRCVRGHEWRARIAGRSKGTGCPICAGKQICSGINDLKTLNPQLASEWNYEKNIGLLPEAVASSSPKKVWWKCAYGHEWQATINNRARGTNCPICSGQLIVSGINDLQTRNPQLASEWHPYNNAGLHPNSISAGSTKKVWWRCDQGHEWQARIIDRHRGSGCPYCSQKASYRIINIETGEIFSSYSEAARKYGITKTPISNCCKGRQKTAGGYHWKYFDEDGE